MKALNKNVLSDLILNLFHHPSGHSGVTQHSKQQKSHLRYRFSKWIRMK